MRQHDEISDIVVVEVPDRASPTGLFQFQLEVFVERPRPESDRKDAFRAVSAMSSAIDLEGVSGL